MLKNLLPIGSVVFLKGGMKKLMVIGIKQLKKDDGDNQEFDYIGVLYPEGFLGDESNFLFNHADINDVVFTGYDNPEREAFLTFADAVYKKLINNKET